MSNTFSVTLDPGYCEQLALRLEQAGITRAELAREASMPPPQISRWLNTPAMPNLRNVIRIERAMSRIQHARHA